MAHSHYVMDLNYRDERKPDRFTREVLRIDAKDDAEAEAEGRRIDGWRQTDFFLVRSIQKSTKTGERLIFDSRSEHPPAAEETVESIIVPVATQETATPAQSEAATE